MLILLILILFVIYISRKQLVYITRIDGTGFTASDAALKTAEIGAQIATFSEIRNENIKEKGWVIDADKKIGYVNPPNKQLAPFFDNAGPFGMYAYMRFPPWKVHNNDIAVNIVHSSI